MSHFQAQRLRGGTRTTKQNKVAPVTDEEVLSRLRAIRKDEKNGSVTRSMVKTLNKKKMQGLIPGALLKFTGFGDHENDNQWMCWYPRPSCGGKAPRKVLSKAKK